MLQLSVLMISSSSDVEAIERHLIVRRNLISGSALFNSFATLLKKMASSETIHPIDLRRLNYVAI